MKRTYGAGFKIILVWLAVAWPGRTVLAQPGDGSSPLSPASIGSTLAGIVECGAGYTSHELYDMKITVLEIVRGAEAWKRIQAAGSGNQAAPVGSEYILARIKFQYLARGMPGLCVHSLKPEQFTAFSADGVEYKTPLLTPPKPVLNGNLHSGDALEGWVPLMVSQQDRKPMMSYSADIGGAVLHGGGKWFRLY